ncbi:MAG: hypothetical protein ACRD82_06180, partial [Blastocatellia bacterium]
SINRLLTRAVLYQRYNCYARNEACQNFLRFVHFSRRIGLAILNTESVIMRLPNSIKGVLSHAGNYF